MVIGLIILSIWVLVLTIFIFKSNYKDDEEINEEIEDDMEYEDADTRHETMSIVSQAHEMFNQIDPMTEAGFKRKRNILKKCEKIANRLISEIYDELFE